MSDDPDLFVDADRSGHFSRPVDPAYRKLIDWLRSDGHLVVCQSLLREYHDAVRGSSVPTTLVALVEHLQRLGRLKHFGKGAIEAFRIKKRISRGLRSQQKDRDHMKIVLLSDRKLGISGDIDFCHDVNNYPGYSANVRRHPSEVPY